MHPTPDDVVRAFRSSLGAAPPFYRVLGAACWLAADLAHALATDLGDVERALDLAKDCLHEDRQWMRLDGPERAAVLGQVAAAGRTVNAADPLLVLFIQAVLEVPLWLDTAPARRVAPALRRLIPVRPIGLTITETRVEYGVPDERPRLRLVTAGEDDG